MKRFSLEILILTGRSFLVLPLSLSLPGKGEFRKLFGQNKTVNVRPVYKHTDTGEKIQFKSKFFSIN